MSKVKALVKCVVENNERVPLSWKERRVTVRLGGSRYAALDFLASKMDGTVTGTAQALIEEAIVDAIEALGYESFEAALPEIVEHFGVSDSLDPEQEANL